MAYITDLGAIRREGYTGRTSEQHAEARARRSTTTSTRDRTPTEGKVRRDYRAGATSTRQVYRSGQWVDEGMALRTTRKGMSEEDKLKTAMLNCKAAGVPAEYLDACAAEYVKRAKPGTPAVKTLEAVVNDLQKAVEEGKLAATPEQPLPAGTPIPRAGLFGIPITYLLIGGAAIVGGIIIYRRRKKS
jgi:hypothetical protein